MSCLTKLLHVHDTDNCISLHPCSTSRLMTCITSSCSVFQYEETDRLNNYAVYHSVHDNFFWMSNFGDTSSFSHHLAVGLVWSKLTVLLSTSPLLCYDPRDYAIALTRIYSTLETEYGDVLQQQNISLGTYLPFHVHIYLLYVL